VIGCLHAKKPASISNSGGYFLLFTIIPFLLLATSWPRKYIKSLRSLILNVLLKAFIIQSISFYHFLRILYYLHTPIMA